MSEVREIQGLVEEAQSGLVGVVDAPDGSKVLVHRQGFELSTLHDPLGREGARQHRFDDVRSFAEWMNRHAEPESAEVLVGAESVGAVLDPGNCDPEHVTCALVKHPAFHAWEQVFGVPMPLRQFHDLARAYSDYLDEADVLLTALRGFSLIRGGEFTQQLDELGAVRLTSANDRQDVQVKINPELTLRVPIFTGVERQAGGREAVVEPEEATYDLRLFVSLELEQRPAFTLTCPGLPLVLKAARDDAAAFARDLLDEGFLVGLGQLEMRARVVPVQGRAAPAETPSVD